MNRNVSRLVIAVLVTIAACISVGVFAQSSQPSTTTGGAPVVTVPGTPPAVSPDIPSQPAVAVKEVTSPAAPSHYGDQAIWALMVSLLIQWLKKTPWFGWITPQSSARLQTQFGFLAAFMTAAGIHFAVSGSVLDGGGASITVTGLSVNAFKDIAWQWASQQGWYQLVVKEPKDVAIVPSQLTQVNS
jgi:hypothetical protein